MGCAQIAMVESRKLISLPAEMVNQFIDKFPALILQKLKEKFQFYADKSTKELTVIYFIQMYIKNAINSELLQRLYIYYSDNQPKNTIKFKEFILKYAILTKSETAIFLRILFQIYKDTHETDLMTEAEYKNFVSQENLNFNSKLSKIKIAVFPITSETFVLHLKELQEEVLKNQQKFILTSEEDVPFSAINKQILDCDFNDLIEGRQYYILSHAWFYRWSFYYQEVNHSIELQKIKSTKMLVLNEPLINSKRRRKRQSSERPTKRNSEDLRLIQMGNSLIQQPKYITFQDIEGQYKGELKENIKASAQIKIITDKLWRLLNSLHHPEQQFKRMALNYESLELYPKSIYYIQANQLGQFVLKSQQVKKGSVNQKLQVLTAGLPQNVQYFIFHKNFGQENWRQVDRSKKFGQISLQPRYLLAVVPHRENFMGKHYRKQIRKQNISMGDEIYTHFGFVKSHSSAYVLGMISDKVYKVHFKGHSFRYETEVNIEDITIKQEQAIQSSAKKKFESIIKGISNVGNTCFINSIIECLIATPVLEDFLLTYKFNEKKQPLGNALSLMAKSLLNNQKANPTEFKKVIDTNMPIFSGYDQHDAQEFLNLLLDKLSQEIPQKPTIIDYLFGGKTKSKLICNGCKAVKYIPQKMYILSLPIPEAQFNFYSIIICPISSKTLKKMVFKLHKTATISEYINCFEERTGQSHKDYLFCESNFNSLKKIKSELTNQDYRNKKILDVGVTPNVALTAFEKIPSKFYLDILSEKTDTNFKDYLLGQNFWTICSIADKQDKKEEKIAINFVNQENDIEKGKLITPKEYKDKTVRLGNKSGSDINYKKIILRKHNAVLKKLQNFGMQFLLGIPKWASYNDIIKIVQRYITNLKSNSAFFNRQQKVDYIIRLLDPSKVRCIFCLKENQAFNLTQQDLQPCCTILQKSVPLAFAARHKAYWIYIDWLDFTKCNYMFCSHIEIDQLSRNVENSREEIQVSLEECISLHNQSEQVQMQCDKCKFKSQGLSHVIELMSNIQVFHMKEFRYTPQGHLIKLDLRLKWQEFLDSSKFSLNIEGKIYQLFSVVKHTGNSNSGHYICMSKRKHPYQNKRVWVNFDDDITDIVKMQQKYIDDAYLLFYKKVDMPTSSLVVYSDLLNK